MTKIKFCGLTRPHEIQAANKLLPDYIGFVFTRKSRRYICPDRALELRRMLDPKIRTVGVFTDENFEVISKMVRLGIISVVQLHGHETESYIHRLRRILLMNKQQISMTISQQEELLKAMSTVEIIKAFSITSERDLEGVECCSADCILLDSPGGGTGKKFDWKLLRKIQRPYFLAGGLTSANVNEVVTKIRPYGVDVSSGIETEGHKDVEKMIKFVSAARDIARIVN